MFWRRKFKKEVSKMNQDQIYNLWTKLFKTDFENWSISDMNIQIEKINIVHKYLIKDNENETN